MISAILVYVLPVAVLMFIIFYVTKASAKAAIYESREDFKKKVQSKEFSDLIRLRDLGLLSDEELEEAIELYRKKSVDQEAYNQYKKCTKVLDELKEMGYFTDDQYTVKSADLKKHFSVE